MYRKRNAYRAEPVSLTIFLKLTLFGKSPNNVVNRALQLLKEHGLLVQKEIKKKVFLEQYLPKLAANAGVPKGEINYSDNQTQLSVYSFHVDLMLILRARLFTLKNLLNTRVNFDFNFSLDNETEECESDVSL